LIDLFILSFIYSFINTVNSIDITNGKLNSLNVHRFSVGLTLLRFTAAKSLCCSTISGSYRVQVRIC